jgi:hypothetical protein
MFQRRALLALLIRKKAITSMNHPKAIPWKSVHILLIKLHSEAGMPLSAQSAANTLA